MVEEIALIDLANDSSALLGLIGASGLSISRRGTGLVDPTTFQPSDLYRIAVRGDIGEQGERELSAGTTVSGDSEAPQLPELVRPSPRHKSMRSEDYLFERSPFDNEQTIGPIAPIARGHVEGTFLEASERQSVSRTCSMSASLSLYRSDRMSERFAAARSGRARESELVETTFVNKLLCYDAILFHLEQATVNPGPKGETIIDLLLRAAALIDKQSVDSAVRIRRLVLAVGDVGRLCLDLGSIASLRDTSAATLFRMSHEAVSKSWPALVAAVANLASTIEHATEDRCQFLFVPYDILGDIAIHECLNRDPLDGTRDLLTSIAWQGGIAAGLFAEPHWRPFNLADVLFAATTRGVTSTSIHIVNG
ncbi:MAG: hypothetical protein AAF950_16905 [Pseudomonadota bacterium]